MDRRLYKTNRDKGSGTARTTLTPSTPGLIYSDNITSSTIGASVEIEVTLEETKTVLATGWINKSYIAGMGGVTVDETFSHYTIDALLSSGNYYDILFTVDGAAFFGDGQNGFQCAPLVYSYELEAGTYTFVFQAENATGSEVIIHGCVILFPV